MRMTQKDQELLIFKFLGASIDDEGGDFTHTDYDLGKVGFGETKFHSDYNWLFCLVRQCRKNISAKLGKIDLLDTQNWLMSQYYNLGKLTGKHNNFDRPMDLYRAIINYLVTLKK